MKAYLSFGLYDIREQDLVSSPVILDYLFGTARGAVEAVSGLSLGGVLLSNVLDYDFPADLPVARMRDTERMREELIAIAGTGGEQDMDQDQWVVVMRPGKGAVPLSRLRAFQRALGSMPLSEGQFAISLMEFVPMSHPMWNVMTADRCHVSSNNIRQPRKGGRTVTDLARECPELWEAHRESGTAGGSQHLTPLFHYDHALYAVRRRLVSRTPADPPEPRLVYCPRSDKDEEQLLHRLPLFNLSSEQALDVSAVEAVIQALGPRSPQAADRH